MATCEVRLIRSKELIATTHFDRVPQVQDTFELNREYFTVLEQTSPADPDLLTIWVRKGTANG